MRALMTACIAGAAAAALSACASGSGYGYNNRYSDRCGGGNEVAGAAVGGGIGALAGSAIAGKGDRTEGAVIGGVAGAVVGSQVAKSNNRCDRYGRPYYR